MHRRRRSDQNEPNGTYTNSFSIGFNGYVFIFEFGMTDSHGRSGVHTRIVTNPADAQQLSELLADAVQQHVSKYGPIKSEERAEVSNSEGCEDLLRRTLSAHSVTVRNTPELQ